MLPRTRIKDKSSEAIPTWGWWVIAGFLIATTITALAVTGLLSRMFTSVAEPILGILLLIALAILYFAPSLVARKSPRSAAIFVANLAFGWTGIGWIIALIWALAEAGSVKSSR